MTDPLDAARQPRDDRRLFESGDSGGAGVWSAHFENGDARP